MDTFDQLTQACWDADPALLARILAQCPDNYSRRELVNHRDHEGNPLWKLVARSGLSPDALPAHVACFRLLVDAGLRLDRPDIKGELLVHRLTYCDPAFAHVLLATPAGRTRMKAHLAAQVRRGGFAQDQTRPWWNARLAEQVAWDLGNSLPAPRAPRPSTAPRL